MIIIGHRGAKGYAPENTLKSFRTALDQGVDMIEFDVFVLKTGEVIVMHDAKVDRTTDGTGFVADMSFEEIRKLDAGDGEKVPTLQEVLDLVAHRIPVNIELKGPGSAEPVAKVVRHVITELGWQADRFVVSSFNHPELMRFHELVPDVHIAVLMDAIPVGYAEYAANLGAYAVNPGSEFVSKAYVEDAHRRGLRVFVWTVDDPDEARLLQGMGVDGVFTNMPCLLRAELEQLS